MSTDKSNRPETDSDSGILRVSDTSASEILDLLMMALKENPLRADLWLMRFDILRTIGLKDDFASALEEAFANPTLRREINWVSVRRMWDELTGGQPPPEGVVLPKPRPEIPGGEEKNTPTRRFSDLALQVAGDELKQLAEEYQAIRSNPHFFMDFAKATHEELNRPTPMHHAQALQRNLGSSSRIFLKREDQHNCTAETDMAAAHVHIATLLNRKFMITGNDVDDFSLALAQAAKRHGLKLTVIVGLLEMDNNEGLVSELRELGADVKVMDSNELMSNDPREGALRLWARRSKTCHLALSFGTGPNPYPRIVSDFQMLLGYESELQLRALGSINRDRTLVAAVHSEADSIGFMLPYLKRADIDLFYAEPSNSDARTAWASSKRLRAYNGARREHSWLQASGRITHIPISDSQAQEFQNRVQQLEGFTISLNDARAVALAAGLVTGVSGDNDVVVLVG